MPIFFYYEVKRTDLDFVPRKGEFDLNDVVWWEGFQPRQDGPWRYAIYLRTIIHNHVVLDEASFQAFAVAFVNYKKSLSGV